MTSVYSIIKTDEQTTRKTGKVHDDNDENKSKSRRLDYIATPSPTPPPSDDLNIDAGIPGRPCCRVVNTFPSGLGLDGILSFFIFILPPPPIPRVGGDNVEDLVPIDLGPDGEGVDCELEFVEGAANVGRAIEDAGAEVMVDLAARDGAGVETDGSLVLLLYTIPVPILDLLRCNSEESFGIESGRLDGVVGAGSDFLGMVKLDLNDEGGGPGRPLLMFKG
jgi:hypothetical protein